MENIQLIQYGVVYGLNDESNSVWLQTLEEQEAQLLKGKFQNEIEEAKELQNSGLFGDANKIYIKIKKQTSNKQVHQALNAKITRNLVVLRKNLQERQSEFTRSQTSSLQQRKKKNREGYDSPRDKRDRRWMQDRESQYLRQTSGNYSLSYQPQQQYEEEGETFYLPKQTYEEEEEVTVTITGKGQPQKTGINGGKQFQQYEKQQEEFQYEGPVEEYEKAALFIQKKYKQQKQGEPNN